MTDIRDHLRHAEIARKPPSTQTSQTLLVQATSTDAHVLDVGREPDLQRMTTDALAEHLKHVIAHVQHGTLTIILNIDRGGGGVLTGPQPPPRNPGVPKGYPELVERTTQLTHQGREAIDVAERLELIGKLG